MRVQALVASRGHVFASLKATFGPEDRLSVVHVGRNRLDISQFTACTPKLSIRQ